MQSRLWLAGPGGRGGTRGRHKYRVSLASRMRVRQMRLEGGSLPGQARDRYAHVGVCAVVCGFGARRGERGGWSGNNRGIADADGWLSTVADSCQKSSWHPLSWAGLAF